MLRPVSGAVAGTVQTHSSLVLDIGAEDLGGTAGLGGDLDVLELEVLAGRRCRAVHARGNVVATGAFDVDPADVLDGNARAVTILPRVCAWRDIYRLVDVLDDEILECHVPHVARPGVRLDPRRIRRVDAPDVLVVHVVHQVRLP